MNSSQAPGENLKENSPVLCFTFLYRVLAESAHTWLSLFCYVSPVNKRIYTRCGFHQEVPVPFADHKSVIEQVLNWWEVRTQLWRRTLMWLSDLHGAQEHPHTPTDLFGPVDCQACILFSSSSFSLRWRVWLALWLLHLQVKPSC